MTLRFNCPQLPDQRTELASGDLVSGEERYIVLMLEVLPLPLLPNGSLPTSLEGEELMGLEFACTSIPEEGSDLRLESRTSSHLVRIQGTQNPAEVVQNTEPIAVIANQQPADAMRKAANSLTNPRRKVPGGFCNATYVRPISVLRRCSDPLEGTVWSSSGYIHKKYLRQSPDRSI
jgi:hypothetical protein